MRRSNGWLLACSCLACASIEAVPEATHPAFRAPARIEPPTEPPAVAPSSDESPVPEPGSSSGHGDLPDPPASSQRAQWRYQLLYDRGTIRVGDVHFTCLAESRRSARRLGRFAFELWVGLELIERVRFDFPLLALDAPPADSAERRGIREPPRFAPGARSSVNLLVPDSSRATRARLLDRATGELLEIPWPPTTRSETAQPSEPAEATASAPQTRADRSEADRAEARRTEARRAACIEAPTPAPPPPPPGG